MATFYCSSRRNDHDWGNPLPQNTGGYDAILLKEVLEKHDEAIKAMTEALDRLTKALEKSQ